ncbi:MAG: hypothetical protein ABIQ72_05715 [Usitatibacter sp.]
MEINEIEVQALRQSTDKASQEVTKELSELQLVLIGGGGGEVIFA